MKKKPVTPIELERYTPTIENGLTDEQVQNRILNGATNSTRQKYSKSYASIFASNFFTFFNLLGLIVTVALIIIQAPLSRFFFVLIYLANIGIGIIQEIRAKLSIDKLSLISSKKIKVIRNGETVEILSTDIVLDDVIFLELGSQIPTDCKVLKGDIDVNESLLTGESVPVKKGEGDTLLSGSFIASGKCFVQAIKVGKDNYVEQLSAKAKKYKKPHSELMSALQWIIKTVGIIIVPIAIAFILKAIFHSSANWTEAIDGTATVVIGLIPSGMFLLTSVALAVGVIKLAKHKTLVQDLYSLEMLARVDTICFDKTGTITDGEMTVNSVIPLEHYSEIEIRRIASAMLGAINDNNQTAVAMQHYFGLTNNAVATKILPFNSIRKLSAVTFDNDATYAFGAPEFVLSREEYQKLEITLNLHAGEGLRVLVLAKSNSIIENDTAPKDFTAIAIILITDNVRPDAIETIEWFKKNGVAIKVISGDNPITVAKVSMRVGVENANKYVSLEGLSDEKVMEIANDYTVFGRVSPEQKALLIKAMRNDGHVVAMTGDGVNDILALKEADCAVSVASGSDAARNISHIVLTDNNFNSMPKVVYEGRRVINNIQSSASLYLMKTLFTMLLAIITLCLPYMHTYPFRLSHMLLLEIFVIGFASFFLSLQPNDNRVEGKFISQVISKSLPSALLMVISVVIVEILKQTVLINMSGYTEEICATMSAIILTFSGMVSLFFICLPLNKYRAALFFPLLVVMLLITAYAIMYGLPGALELYSMWPIKDYWLGLLIMVAIIVMDIPMFIILKELCMKIKIPSGLRKKHRK